MNSTFRIAFIMTSTVALQVYGFKVANLCFNSPVSFAVRVSRCLQNKGYKVVLSESGENGPNLHLDVCPRSKTPQLRSEQIARAQCGFMLSLPGPTCVYT